MNHPELLRVVVRRLSYPSARAFKAAKRRELRQLEKALSLFRFGCAGCPSPASSFVRSFQGQLDRLKQTLSVRQWGR
jgi:hypothetical protein